VVIYRSNKKIKPKNHKKLKSPRVWADNSSPYKIPETPAWDRLYSFYEKNMENRDKLFWQQELEHMKADMEKCTFKPDINKTFNHSSKSNLTPHRNQARPSKSPNRTVNQGKFDI
jgi:hypothetical protein